nr:MAG TPA: hypothetical protein [Caudoviricetes sp.]
MWVISVVKFLNKLPKGLRVVIYVLLGLTVVFWVLFLLAQILEVARKVVHWMSQKSVFWTGFYALAILCVGTFLVAEFVLHLGWWDKLVTFFTNWFNVVREFIGGKISGK